ncbi:MAG: glutamyl-tRNA reductase [Alphaproteobacteria bacterium]
MADGAHRQLASMPERPFAVGASFRTATAGVRDRLFFDAAEARSVLETGGRMGLPNLMGLATCDRVELIGCSRDPEADIRKAEDILRDRLSGTGPGGDTLYRLYDIDAVRHVFRIASALDSQMVGESQILGQFKDAISLATEAGSVTGELDRLLQAALALAKRVRTTTRIGEGAVSAAAAAVKVATDLHGPMEQCRALLIGLGETGWLIAEQFQNAGIAVLNVTGPSRRTEREAARRGIPFQPFDRLADILPSADVVITCSGHGRYLLDRPAVVKGLESRRHAPQLIVDAAVPGDVDPDVGELDDAFLYTLSDIERLAEKGQLDRKAEALEAEAMVESALSEWRREQAEREGVPGLVALRDHFEQLRQDVLSRHPNAGPQEATRLVVNRILHEPSETLRRIAMEGETADLKDTITVNRVLERLFGLSIQPDDRKNK